MEDTRKPPPIASEIPNEKDMDDIVHEMPPTEEPPVDTPIDGDDLVHAMPPPAPLPTEDPDDAVHEAAPELDVTDDRM